MGNGSAKKMKIKVRTDNGKHDPVVGTDGDTVIEPTEVTPEQVQEIYDGQGFKHVGVILYSKSSPGCVYYFSGGKCYRVCR